MSSHYSNVLPSFAAFTSSLSNTNFGDIQFVPYSHPTTTPSSISRISTINSNGNMNNNHTNTKPTIVLPITPTVNAPRNSTTKVKNLIVHTGPTPNTKATTNTSTSTPTTTVTVNTPRSAKKRSSPKSTPPKTKRKSPKLDTPTTTPTTPKTSPMPSPRMRLREHPTPKIYPDDILVIHPHSIVVDDDEDDDVDIGDNFDS